MARGFESKDVEQQQQEALERRDAARRTRGLTPEQMECERKRDGFALQRKRVLNDLEACRESRRRQMLETGLKYLDEQLAALPAKS